MCFRFLYNVHQRIMSIHFLELENEPTQKEFQIDYHSFIEVFHKLIQKVLRCSYKNLQDENQDDEPFNVFLLRNKKVVKEKRNLKNVFVENNLLFKVIERLNQFEMFTKKIQYVKSGTDVLFHKGVKIDIIKGR